MTKSERKNLDQKLFENAGKLNTTRVERFQKFTAALTAYNMKSRDELTLDDFQSVAESGTLYFQSLIDIADAIIGGNVDRRTRDNTFAPLIVEALQRNIPLYYDTLQKIAGRIGVPYRGEFRKTDYLSLFEVAEKHSAILWSSNPTMSEPRPPGEADERSPANDDLPR